MAPRILKNCKCYLGGYNISGDLNQMALDYKAEIKEITTFNDSSKRRMAGLLDLNAKLQGYWQAADSPAGIDKIMWDEFSLTEDILTICPTDGSAGETAFFSKILMAQYSPGGQVGEVLSFSADIQGNERLIRGIVAETGAKTVTGNGTARNLGAVTATQKMYAALHVTAASGITPTLDAVIQSDDAEGMLSPVTRIAFSQVTAIGSEWKTVDGAITDTWWRPAFTIGGVDPSFTIVLVLGII